jgi:hypothetical protein
MGRDGRLRIAVPRDVPTADKTSANSFFSVAPSHRCANELPASAGDLSRPSRSSPWHVADALVEIGAACGLLGRVDAGPHGCRRLRDERCE